MTNEEAIERLQRSKRNLELGKAIGAVPEESADERIEAYDLAIKALETGEVYMTGEDYNLYMEGYKAGKKDFEPKQGEWILVHPLQEDDEGTYMCSMCKTGYWCISSEFKFCPYCGAKMRGGTE